jgi:branched-chain amino acid transport system substrate-binding protein
MNTTRRAFIASALATVPTLARAQAKDTLKVGVLTDLSGQYRDSAGETSIVCTKQAASEFMAANPGITVEVVAADHQNKPDAASSIVREWFDRGGVDVVTNCNNSAVARAVANLAQEKNRVHVNTGAVSADLTGIACTSNFVHWPYDTWEETHSTGGAMTKAGGDTWFCITADYLFGHNLQRDLTAAVQAQGGKVVGAAPYPFPGTTDFSAQMVEAQGSGAKVVAFCNAGGDFVNCVKQAHEFGLVERGQKIAGMVVFSTDIHALGLDIAKGLILTSTFYWDLNDRTRAFTDRVKPKTPDIWPNELHASDYAGTLHYLKAARELGVAQAKASGLATVNMMKRMPTEDDCFGRGLIRPDGRTIHNAYLFEVKSPAESKQSWDLWKLLATTPGDQAFRPLADGGCKLVKS